MVTKQTGAAATVKKTAAKPKSTDTAADGTAATDAGAQADKLAPATEMEASGALIEPEIVERVDTSHPAVDDNPRKGTSVDSNKIDFNDPTLSQEEAVLKNLGVDPAEADEDGDKDA